MRYYLVASLITCGTLLAMAPTASDFVQGCRLAAAVSGEMPAHAASFFRQPLEESYRVGSWMVGIAMISLGIARGWQRDAPRN